MHRRPNSNSSIFDSDDGSPINPFLRTTRQDKNRYCKHNTPIMRTRSPSPSPLNSKKTSNFYSSFFNLTLFLPVTLVVCLSIIFYLVVISKNKNLIFCSDDKNYEKCRPCPRNGNCLNGKLKCNQNYTLDDGICVPISENIAHKTIELLNKMCKFIASSIQKNCDGNVITYANLEQKFGKDKYYASSIALLDHYGLDTEYQILYIEPDGFLSLNPILNTKCKCKVFFKENKFTFLLLGFTILLILILFLVLTYNQRTNMKIKRCSNEVIRNIKRSQRGEFKPSSEYTFSNSNPMSKFWDKISNEVEKNPSITVLNSVNGKLWGHL